MITIKTINQRSRPVVMCDKCHEQITDADNAMVVLDAADGSCTRENPGFYHKDVCDPGFKVNAWIDLSRFLVNLLHNSGLSSHKLTAAVERSEHMIAMGL